MNAPTDTALSRALAALGGRIVELQAQNRELLMQQLAADGQAAEAYQAQLAAQAALAWIEDQTKHAPPGSFTALIHTKAKEALGQ